jgi:hypothetical protein
MTIYRVYVENGNRAGFWVQHRTWGNTCARVRSIAGKAEGKLPGAAPNYDDSPVAMQMFDVRSGRPMSADESINIADRQYTRIAEPFWSHLTDQRAGLHA